MTLFSTHEGLKYFQQLYVNRECYVFRDNRRRRLVLYGPDETKLAVQQELIKKTKDLQNYSHAMRLNEEEFKAARGGGLSEIISTFGKEAVSLRVTRDLKIITIYGTEQDFKTAKHILKSHLWLFDEDSNSDQICPVCLDDSPEDPFTTPCGHVYCKSAFIRQFNENPMIPITCYGGNPVCGKVLPLDTLKIVLSSTELERLLYDSFETYIRSHPKEFAYCPTPTLQREEISLSKGGKKRSDTLARTAPRAECLSIDLKAAAP